MVFSQCEKNKTTENEKQKQVMSNFFEEREMKVALHLSSWCSGTVVAAGRAAGEDGAGRRRRAWHRAAPEGCCRLGCSHN